MIDDTS